MNGFVTLGKGELLLTLGVVSLLMVLLGIGVGQIYLMARRPAVVKPEPCTRLHCDDAQQMGSWLRDRDYALVTREVLATVDFSKPRGRHAMTDTAERRASAKPDPFRAVRYSEPSSLDDAVRRTFERRRQAPSPLQHWRDEERPDIFGQGDDLEWAAWNAPSPADTQSTDRWPTEDQG